MKSFLKISDHDLAVIKKLEMNKAYVWLATWFGTGFFRPAPGTWGSIGALPFGIIMLAFGNIGILLCAIVIVTWLGIKVTEQFERATGEHDSKMIVIDEVAGQWIAMLPLAYFWTSLSDTYTGIFIVLSFLLFRAFDVTKPWPASYCDKKIDSAFGVMADDLVAGIYAAAILTGVIVYAGLG